MLFIAQPCGRDGFSFRVFHQEDTVKTSFNYQQIESREETEKEVNANAKRLEKFLKRFAPDLVQLHGAFERNPHKNSFALSLNLSLPTGTLHATGEGADAVSSVRTAFAEILAQLKKHMGKLRKDYEWKRKRTRRMPAPDGSLAS
jgi:ribosome-associated translation inhibitor RaiA